MNISRRHLLVATCLLLAVCAAADVKSQTKKKPRKDPALNLPVDKILYAINAGDIGVGTDIRDVNKLLDTDNEIYMPKKGQLAGSNFYTRYPKQWIFSFSWDEEGKLVRCALTNYSGKLGTMPEDLPDQEVCTSYLNKFRSASDELSRLSICMEAMTKNVLYEGMPSEEFNNFIGTHEAVLLPSKKYVYCHYFSDTPLGWRLFYFERDGRITSYLLTNQDAYFSGIPEYYWQYHDMNKN